MPGTGSPVGAGALRVPYRSGKATQNARYLLADSDGQQSTESAIGIG